MTTRDQGDPFASADAVPLNVPGGVFDSRPDEAPDRTGSTNARILLGGPLSRVRAAPVAKRAGWLVAVASIALMLVVIPAGITTFASVRRAAIEAAEEAAASPEVVVLSAASVAVQEGLQPIDSAYLMSSGIAADPEKSEMARLLSETNTFVMADNAASAKTSSDAAVSYFVSTYSQSLPGRAATILEEYPESNWETDERIDELGDIIRSNAQGQDLSALVSAVVELPQRVGDAMSEHLGNRVTYVPPSPTSTPAPTTSIQPQSTQQQPTQKPSPTYTQGPNPDDGDDDNDNGNNGGGGGNRG